MTQSRAMPTAAEVKAQLTGPGGPFEVVTDDVRGRPMQVYKDRMKALRQICEISIGRGDQVFIVHGDRNVTFHDFLTTANSVSAGLQEFGIGPGDRVAVLSQNNPEWCETFWGTVNIDAWALYRNYEVAMLARDADTVALFEERILGPDIATSRGAKAGGGIGARVRLSDDLELFAEAPGRAFVVSGTEEAVGAIGTVIGRVGGSELEVEGRLKVAVSELETALRSGLSEFA